MVLRVYVQIGVLAEIRRGELVQFAVAVELEVGLFCRREESVGREEPWVPQGPLPMCLHDFHEWLRVAHGSVRCRHIAKTPSKQSEGSLLCGQNAGLNLFFSGRFTLRRSLMTPAPRSMISARP